MQKEVAKIAGIHSRTYSDLESGVTHRVPLPVADTLAAFYQVPVDDLISREV